MKERCELIGSKGRVKTASEQATSLHPAGSITPPPFRATRNLIEMYLSRSTATMDAYYTAP